MNNFGLFDFISKLSSSKEAQTSLINLISGLAQNNLLNKNANAENGNDKSVNTANNSNGKPASPDFKSDVYRSPASYTIYNEMIEKHIKISKEIDSKNRKNS